MPKKESDALGSQNDPILDIRELCRRKPMSPKDLKIRVSDFGWTPSVAEKAIQLAWDHHYIRKNKEGLFVSTEGPESDLIEPMVAREMSEKKDSKKALEVIEGGAPNLIIDPMRFRQTVEAQTAGLELPTTGVFVRAKTAGGEYENVDILLLTASSLLAYLKKDGGDNQLAEDIVGIITGHGRLHSYG